MKNKVIITNKNWFINYAILRTILIVISLSVILVPYFLEIEKKLLVDYLEIIAITLLTTILIFDFLQKPSYLELIKSKSGFILKQYHPDNRYFFFFREKKVNTLHLENEEELNCKIFQGIIPLLNQIEFHVTKSDKSKMKSEKINIGWISDSQLKRLTQYVTKLN